jgi:hypothetical protein
MTANADSHPAEARITGLRDDERFNVEAAAAENGADAAEDTWLIIHHDTERVDVDDIRLRSRLFVGGGCDFVAHGRRVRLVFGF